LVRRMIGAIVIVSGLVGLALASVFLLFYPEPTTPEPSPTLDGEVIALPEPRYDSDVSIEEVLLERRSVREYTGEPLTLQEISQLMWAAQGITDPRGYRTAPSAGGGRLPARHLRRRSLAAEEGQG